MKTVLSTIAHLIILFLIPLLGRLELILHPYIILSATMIIILLITQPQIKFNEVVRDKQTDKGTILLIFLCIVSGHVGTIIEWAYLPQLKMSWLPFIGIAFLISGLVFRIIAIKNLDKAFSSTLQIKDKQKLITTGLYSKFRHPSYTGAWISMLGNAVLFQSIIGFIILGIGLFMVYMQRIQVEESMLLNEYGNEYERYAGRTWKFLPGY